MGAFPFGWLVCFLWHKVHKGHTVPDKKQGSRTKSRKNTISEKDDVVGHFLLRRQANINLYNSRHPTKMSMVGKYEVCTRCIASLKIESIDEPADSM